MSETILSIQGVTKKFGNSEILRNISLEEISETKQKEFAWKPLQSIKNGINILVSELEM